jgi:hypothetical protein
MIEGINLYMASLLLVAIGIIIYLIIKDKRKKDVMPVIIENPNPTPATVSSPYGADNSAAEKLANAGRGAIYTGVGPDDGVGPGGYIGRYLPNPSYGPAPGEMIGVPVPLNSLKSPPGNLGIFKDDGSSSFFSSMSKYLADTIAPIKPVDTTWTRTGILTTTHGKDAILNLYIRPIAPGQDVWEYQVEDKDGFVIPLDNRSFIEDGDIVKYIPGKRDMGPWKANIFSGNRYVWV